MPHGTSFHWNGMDQVTFNIFPTLIHSPLRSKMSLRNENHEDRKQHYMADTPPAPLFYRDWASPGHLKDSGETRFPDPHEIVGLCIYTHLPFHCPDSSCCCFAAKCSWPSFPSWYHPAAGVEGGAHDVPKHLHAPLRRASTGNPLGPAEFHVNCSSWLWKPLHFTWIAIGNVLSAASMEEPL